MLDAKALAVGLPVENRLDRERDTGLRVLASGEALEGSIRFVVQSDRD